MQPSSANIHSSVCRSTLPILQYWRTHHKWYVDGADFVILAHIRVTGGGVEVISLPLSIAYLVIFGFTKRLHTQLTASHITRK